MTIQGMTLQEMANYLVNLSTEQLSKLAETNSVLRTGLDRMDSLRIEDQIFCRMWITTCLLPLANNEELKTNVMNDEVDEGSHYVFLAEMRKRHLI